MDESGGTFVTTVPSNSLSLHPASPNQTSTVTSGTASVPKFVTLTRTLVTSPTTISPSNENASRAKPTSIPLSFLSVLSSTVPYSAIPSTFVVTDTDSYAMRSVPSEPTAPVMPRSCSVSECNKTDGSPIIPDAGSYVAHTVSVPASLSARLFHTSMTPPSALGRSEKSGGMSQSATTVRLSPNRVEDTRSSPSSHKMRKAPSASCHANGLVASAPSNEIFEATLGTPPDTAMNQTSRASSVIISPSPSLA